MTLEIDIPDSVRESLPTDAPDFSRFALEALAVEGYRKRMLGTFQVRQMLGLGSRMETIDFLGDRGVYPNYTKEDVLQDLKTLRELVPE